MKNLNKKIIIAVDGFSSCGKSTFAKLIAAKLGYVFIDTGAMYRAVTLCAQCKGAIKEGKVDEGKVVGMMDEISISFKFNAKRGASDIYVNDTKVEDQIRSIEVSRDVSAVSAIGEVRARLVTIQQQMGKQKGIVMDGRDIGTVVFPEAELKIFMTADPKVRAQRRFDELIAKGDNVSYEEVLKNVISRDEADMNRSISPLRQASDAIVCDNSYMTLDEEIMWFEKEFERVQQTLKE